jgi:NAD(P)H-hydrate epimerase
VQKLIEISPLPMVIDADGLNALAQDLSVLKRRRSTKVIITPHPGEMARLIGTSIPDVAAIRISVAQEFARTHDLHVVLKGARTIIAAPNGLVAINGSGNPGMASGGMGDLLTGVITALLGQGYSPLHACKAGVFVHGLAGDMVAREKGEIGINATDLLEMLPYAFNRLSKMTGHHHTQPSDSDKECI